MQGDGLKVTLYALMFEGTCPPTVTMPTTTPCTSIEVVGDVIVVVIVVVDTEVEVSRLLDPTMYPAPALANIATTSRAAMVQFPKPWRVASRGVKLYS